ncbi:MAG TPA: hypothetical protein VIH94_04030 [Candidatus Limnocylindrales bacterium]
MRIRRAILLFLPLAIVATGLAGLVYLVAQQEGRWLANEPQIQLAEDAAARLDAGGKPGDQVGSATVDIARSLAPFVVVYGPTGTILATDGTLDGQPPDVPAGVLDSARSSGRNAVTWQPRVGVRIATVTVPWSGGSVLAGRSLRLVEQEASNLELVVGAAWLAILAALAVASLVVAHLWPRSAVPA